MSVNKQNTLKISSIEASPCTAKCPVGTNVKSYVSLIAAGKFNEALEVVRETNPFPGICGRVCPHPCEDTCNRNEVDKPVAIAALKRFLADYELRRGIIPKIDNNVESSEKKGNVAIIGSGPAGLTCAADLARMNYHVTVYESLPVPGGLLAVGIPEYRLPRDILNIEIDAIKNLGVEIICNTKVGDTITLQNLIKDYDALFIATGAHKPTTLGISGEKEIREGIVDWINLLKSTSLGKGEKPGDNVVVIGGGNSAVDSARVALRLGAEKVTILYRRSREEMPAFKEEVVDAKEEGIDLKLLCAPVKLIHENGRLSAVECIKMKLGEPDKSGRARPVPIKGSVFTVPCDAIISAIGQQIDGSFLSNGNTVKVSKWNLIKADPVTMATSCKGVFAGGDAVTGPGSVIGAISAGHTAAESIHRFICGLPVIETQTGDLSNEASIEMPAIGKKPRIEFHRLSGTERKSTFREINQVYTQAQAVAEAERCERCGPCLECNICVGICEKKQVIIEPGDFTTGQQLQADLQIVRVTPEVHRALSENGDQSITYNDKPYMASVFCAQVNEDLCRGCGQCEETCGFNAVRVVFRNNGLFLAVVDEDMCRGCGTCLSVCPTNAINQKFFASEKISEQVNENICENDNKIVHFACHWRTTNDSRSLVSEKINIMCAGRINIGDILAAFENGAAGVLIHCCDSRSCHYGFGCATAEANMDKLYNVLDLLGINRERIKIIRTHMESKDSTGDFIGTIKELDFALKGRKQ